MMQRRKGVSLGKREPPKLVDLCVDVAIQNFKYLGDVGDTDFSFLERILPHCPVEQLIHIEDSTDRDLSPVTDKLWKKIFEKQFGERSMSSVIERMNQKGINFGWRKLYEAKLKDVAEAENEAIGRLKKSYEKLDARKQSRQIQICSKVPPSKRSFFGGSGPGCSSKSTILKKAKIDYINSREVKNAAAMRQIGIQKSRSLYSRPTVGNLSGRMSSSSTVGLKPVRRS